MLRPQLYIRVVPLILSYHCCAMLLHVLAMAGHGTDVDVGYLRYVAVAQLRQCDHERNLFAGSFAKPGRHVSR